MKRRFAVLLMIIVALPIVSQGIAYSSLKKLLACDGDTVSTLRVEKRSRNQIVLSGGADYRITADHDEAMCNLLKKRSYAVCTAKGDLYVNCRKLRYKKLRFGAWYAPAIRIGKNIYFSAMPLGSVVGHTFVDDNDVRLGGTVGEALATSSLVTHRVYYEINGETGGVDFLGKDKILNLLDSHPIWRNEYLKENSIEASRVEKYLLYLKKEK